MEEEKNLESQNQTETVSQPSLISNVFKVFYEPSSVFQSLTKKTNWLVPFIIIVLVLGIMGHLVKPIMVDYQMQGQMKALERYRDQLPAEQFREIENRIQEQFESMAEFHWYDPLIVIAFVFVFFAIISLIGWLTGNFIYGGKANFWIVMNAIAFAGLIGLSGDIIRDIMMLTKGSADVFIGLGLLKSTVGSESFLFYLFRQIDLFTLWRIIVTCIGLGAVYKISSKKFAYIIFPLWIVFICLVAFANTFAGGTIIY